MQAASKEIKTGEHIQLDWPLENVQFPGFGRKPFDQKVINAKDVGPIMALDDEIHINTQSGSQWDSLKHVRRPTQSPIHVHFLTSHTVRTSEDRDVLQWTISRRSSKVYHQRHSQYHAL